MIAPIEFTPGQIRMIERMRDEGRNVTAIADRLGISKGVLIRRYGADSFSKGNQKPVQKPTNWRREIEGMDNETAIDLLIDVLEIYESLLVREIPGIDHKLFTQQEWRLVCHLYDNLGKTVEKSSLVQAISMDAVLRGTGTNPKIVDVILSRVRKKLPHTYRIKTHWGFGLEMEKVDGNA